jgi:hypothetical protein
MYFGNTEFLATWTWNLFNVHWCNIVLDSICGFYRNQVISSQHRVYIRQQMDLHDCCSKVSTVGALNISCANQFDM